MPDSVEEIVTAYVLAADGDRDRALRAVVVDALEDLCEAERRTACQNRLVSRGFVRSPITASTMLAENQFLDRARHRVAS